MANTPLNNTITENGMLKAAKSALVADVSGTADATYSANEQTLINDLVTAVNALLDIVEEHNLMSDT